MIKKVIAVLMLIAMLGISVSCREEYPKEFNYHTEILFTYVRDVVFPKDKIGGFAPSFLEDNLTKDILYVYEDPETGNQVRWRDIEAPKQRCYIVKTQEQWDEIFNEPITVDFETQMLVVTFVTVKPSTCSRLKDVSLKENKLIIESYQQYSDKIQTREPLWSQAITVYRMDKIDDVSSVEEVFIKKKKI